MRAIAYFPTIGDDTPYEVSLTQPAHDDYEKIMWGVEFSGTPRAAADHMLIELRRKKFIDPSKIAPGSGMIGRPEDVKPGAPIATIGRVVFGLGPVCLAVVGFDLGAVRTSEADFSALPAMEWIAATARKRIEAIPEQYRPLIDALDRANETTLCDRCGRLYAESGTCRYASLEVRPVEAGVELETLCSACADARAEK